MRLVWFRERWYAYERVAGQPKRYSLGTADRKAAERRLIDLEQQRRRKATTISEMHAVYLTDRYPQITGQETFRLAWIRLSPIFGHLRPDQVTRPLTRAYGARERKRGVGDGSIRRDLGVLNAIIRYSDPNTSAIVELPPAPPPRHRYLTREEYRALRDAAKAIPHCWVFVWLAYRTAGRAQAILSLTWNGVDFERGMIDLGRGAGNKGRAIVPMADDLADVLREAKRGALSDYVVEWAGKQVNSIKRAFKSACDRAGLDDVSPHVLRHSAAVHMVESGVPMAEVAQFLGHSSEAVTFRVYARFSPYHLRRAAGALE